MTATLRDVAKLAGVSISTASRALSGAGTVAADTEDRVLEAMEQLNYRPAVRAGGRRVKPSQISEGCVGVILGVARYKFSDPYWSRVLDGLDAELARRGYELGFTLTVDELENGQRNGPVSRKEYDALVLLGDFAQRQDLFDPGKTVVVGGEECRAAAVSGPMPRWVSRVG